jgi:putative oxidoreductase
MAAGFVLRCKVAYASFERALYAFRSPLLLLVRLYWGFQFMQNGWGKLHNLPHVTQFFVSLHVPMPGVMAPAIALLEFVGGIFLILGLLSRLTALLLALDMIVAFLLADRDVLSTIFSSDPSKFYCADPFTFLCATVLIAVLGTGVYSVDYLLAGKHEVY